MSTQTIIEYAIDRLRTAAFEVNDERERASYELAADDLEDALHDVQKEAEALRAFVDAFSDYAKGGGYVALEDLHPAYALACEALNAWKEEA